MKYTNSEGKPDPEAAAGRAKRGLAKGAPRRGGRAREDKKKAPAGPDIIAGADDFKAVLLTPK